MLSTVAARGPAIFLMDGQEEMFLPQGTNLSPGFHFQSDPSEAQVLYHYLSDKQPTSVVLAAFHGKYS